MIPAIDRFQYYQQLAGAYDRDRFENNSYGRFLDQEEREIIAGWLALKHDEQVLNAACGTGRFMEFCTHGLDISPNMIQIAARKHPGKSFRVRPCQDTFYAEESFDTVLAMHFIMHQTKKEVDDFVDECYHLLKPGGRLIIDFPSKKRRSLLSRTRAGWHGNNAYDLEELKNRYSDAFQLKRVAGLMFLPMHRIPCVGRNLCLKMDQWLGRSVLKEYSSYLLVEMVKK